MNNYLLKYCLYYKGEKECPKDDKNSLFWWYEFDWIERMSKDNSDISNMLEYYIRVGLSTFQMFDNTPITLKALLFNRYSHWTMGDIDGFKEWYLTAYRNDAQQR